MKSLKHKLILIVLAILTAGISLSLEAGTTYAAGSNPYCLGASGKFTALNWPSGQTIDVACAGDTGTAGCTGHKVTLSPGQSYDFNNCTCAPYGTEGDGGVRGLTGGCIFVGRSLRLAPQNNGNILVLGDTSMPAGCTLTGGDPIACGSNGQVITQPFTITCQAPTPTPTPTRTPTPTPTRTPTPTKTPTPTPTRTPTPTPTKTPTPTPTHTPTPTPTGCPIPGAVPNVRINCPNCSFPEEDL